MERSVRYDYSIEEKLPQADAIGNTPRHTWKEKLVIRSDLVSALD
jgi:hypothetical protein